MYILHLQDTVLALQALAEMASLIYSSQYNLDINVTPSTGATQTFSITNLNALVLQSRQVGAVMNHLYMIFFTFSLLLHNQ